jgi:hypothetical protein
LLCCFLIYRFFVNFYNLQDIRVSLTRTRLARTPCVRRASSNASLRVHGSFFANPIFSIT